MSACQVSGLDMVKFDKLLLNREQGALNSSDFTLDQKHRAAGKSSWCFFKSRRRISARAWRARACGDVRNITRSLPSGRL
jgi:hypothetical protein